MTDEPSLAERMVAELAQLHGRAPTLHQVNARLGMLTLPLATAEDVARAVEALGVPRAPPPVERWGEAPGWPPPGVNRQPRRWSA